MDCFWLPCFARTLKTRRMDENEKEKLKKPKLGFNLGSGDWIGTAIQAGGSILGAALQAAGTAVNRKKYDMIANGVRRRRESLASKYREQLATPYTQTAEGSNMLREMRDAADANARRMANSAVRTGASPEAVAAQAGASQAATAEAAGRMAAAGTRRQDNLRQQMIGQLSALDNQYDKLKLDQINASNQAWASLASGFSK